MTLADSSPSRLALPNEKPVKNWQVILAAIFVLLLLGGIVGFAIWGARNRNAEQGQAIRPTFATGQFPKFALPSAYAGLSSNDIQVKTSDGAAVNGLEIGIGGASESPELQVSNPEILKPGSYKIEVVKEGRRLFVQDFSWGVLALNYAKSVYVPGEDVALDIAVLDEKGGMVCDAQVMLEIVSPSGRKQSLGTKEGEVIAHPECQKKEYVAVPDYEAHFKVEESGQYQLKLTAVTRNGIYWIQDFVPVEDNPAFVVERKTNTRIYPPENYPVILTIYSRDGFKGSVAETLRSDFVLVDGSGKQPDQGDFSEQVVVDKEGVTPNRERDAVGTDSAKQNAPFVTVEGAHMLLTWRDVQIEPGQTNDLSYIYNAPDVSPELYVIGPTTLSLADSSIVYTHNRLHQLAMDDLPAGFSAAYSAGGDAPTENPVAFWKFNEMQGTTAHDSFSPAKDMTLSSASWSANGRMDGAWTGSGSTWLTLADDNDFDITTSDDFALSFWFKSASATNPGNSTWLLNKSLSSGVQELGYAVYTKTNGRVCFGWETDSSWGPDNEVCTPSDVYDATWHHLAVTHDGASGQIDLSIDARLAASAAPPLSGGGSPNTESAPATNGGFDTSIAIGNDGYPVISHIRTSPSNALWVTKCGNALCSSGNTNTVLDFVSVGNSTSIDIGSDGYPVISYKGSSNVLKMVKYSNAACTVQSITDVDLTFSAGADSSLAVGTDGYPVIAYSGGFSGVKVAKCANLACTSVTTAVLDTDASSSTPRTSLTIGSDGYPVVSYWSITNGVKVTKCGNASCTSGNTTSIVGPGGSFNTKISLAVGSDGNPILSYYIPSPQDLRVAKCGDLACTSGPTFTEVDTTGDVGRYSAIAIGTDNLPVIAYHDFTNQELKVVKCGNGACSSGNRIVSVDSTGNPGQYVDIAIGVDDNPVMSYNGLSVLHCGSESCLYWPSGSMANSRSLFVGDRQGSDNGDEFTGDIDEFRFFRSALTTQQIQMEFNFGNAAVLGSAGTTSTGAADNSMARQYCVPGDSTSCNAPRHVYRLDENTGTANRDIGAGANAPGTMTGGTSVAFVPAVHGAGVLYDGTGARTTFASELYDETSAFTISTWLMMRDFGNDGVILGSSDGLNSSFSFYPGYRAGQVMALHYCGSSDCNDETRDGNSIDNVIAQTNRWYHVAMTYNGSNACRFYVNGIDVTGDAVCGETSGAYTTDMGGTASALSNHAIDNLVVYNYVRTPAQINWDYNRGDPIAWYRFDECSGSTANDAAGNGFVAAISIGTGGSQTTAGTCSSGIGTQAWNNGAAGRLNASLTLDGTDDAVQIADDARLRFESTVQDFSVFAWVKRGVVGTTQYIISKEDADNDGYRLMINSNNTVTCSVNATDMTTTRTISDTGWHHIGCAVARSGISRVYIDGKSYTAVGISSQTIPTTSALVIGSLSYSPASYLNGQIDDVRIFTYPLSQSQVREVYGNGVVSFR